MKTGREHRVPLSARAIAILKEMAQVRQNEFVFPGAREGRPISRMALVKLIERLAPEVTVHGFRSTFRDWCAEQTNFPREAAELALAHSVGDSVERAYQRSDLLEKRRQMMEEWAAFCEPKRTNVVHLRQTAEV